MSLAVEHQVDEQGGSLRTYLNDHLGRATAITALARRAASRARGPLAGRLSALAKEFDDDRQDLLTLMASLNVRVKHIKVLSSWLSTRWSGLVQRRRRGDESLASVLEIESLRAGVQRKLSSWEVLRTYLGSQRGEQRRLERLIARARRQLAELAQLHRQTAAAGRSRLLLSLRRVDHAREVQMRT